MWFSFIYSYCFQSIKNRRDVTGQSICTILFGDNCQKHFMVVSAPPMWLPSAPPHSEMLLHIQKCSLPGLELSFVICSHFHCAGRSGPLKLSAMQRARRGVEVIYTEAPKERGRHRHPPSHPPPTPPPLRMSSVKGLGKARFSRSADLQNHMHALIKAVGRRRRDPENNKAAVYACNDFSFCFASALPLQQRI